MKIVISVSSQLLKQKHHLFSNYGTGLQETELRMFFDDDQSLQLKLIDEWRLQSYVQDWNSCVARMKAHPELLFSAKRKSPCKASPSQTESFKNSQVTEKEEAKNWNLSAMERSQQSATRRARNHWKYSKRNLTDCSKDRMFWQEAVQSCRGDEKGRNIITIDPHKWKV